MVNGQWSMVNCEWRHITIHVVAMEVCTSESKLKRVFRQTFNSGCIAYLTKVRMEVAIILLEENKKSINEICILTAIKISAASGVQHSAFSIQHSAFSIRHSAFSVQHSAFSIQRIIDH